MKNRTYIWIIRIFCICILVLSVILLLMRCNGSPTSSEDKITYIETETETGIEVTVLRNNVEILRIEAKHGKDGEQGDPGPPGSPGSPGKDWIMPDTLYLKLIDFQNGVNQFAVSDIPFPPEEPVPDSLYIKDVILEDGEWAFILRGDSLRLRWNQHCYKDINGRPIDPADLYFHVAYENRAGEVFSLKPFENVTQDTFLVMYGLSLGTDIFPAVSAFKINEIGNKIYSIWWISKDHEWFVRRE